MLNHPPEPPNEKAEYDSKSDDASPTQLPSYSSYVSSIHDQQPRPQHLHPMSFREHFYYNGPGPEQHLVPSPMSSEHAPEVAPVAFENPEDVGLQYPVPHHAHHRSLSPPLSQGSTIISQEQAGMASMFAGEKEVYNVNSEAYPEHIVHPETQENEKKRKMCGIPVLLFLALAIIAVLAVVGVALGVGLGLGLSKKPHQSSSAVSTPTSPPAPVFTGNANLSIGGAINPAYYSTTGVFNGTGIAFAGVGQLIFVFFQYYTGDLRFVQLQPDGTWIGGSPSEVVATDAKNSTPISTVAYIINGTQKYHVFYIDKNNYIKQRTYTNATNIWKDGEITAQRLKAYDADSVGLQACWYGNFYGDSDFSKFPTATGQPNKIPFGSDHGMHLWFANDSSTFQQYGFYEGQSNWTFQQSWPGLDPHGGIGCFSWGPGDVSYFMAVNLQNTVEVWWKDTNTSVKSTASHPINTWVNATEAAIPNVFPSTSLGYTDYFIAQGADEYIHGYNISFNSENTTYSPSEVITVSDPSGPVQALGGSHLSVSAVAAKSGGANLYVFAQTEGNDITFFTRDLDGGPWGAGKLPIPPT